MACLISSTIASVSARIGYLSVLVKRPGFRQEHRAENWSGTLAAEPVTVNRLSKAGQLQMMFRWLKKNQ